MASNVRNNFIQAYLDANKLLVKTLIVKSNYAAHAINQKLIKELGESAVDKFNPQSWKYYVNLSGEYHITDTIMYVISLDTKQKIIFDTESLKFHTATAEAYKHGTRYYYSLVRSYPHQEFLINCILTPTDVNKAIIAEDGSILAYPSYLVEEHENTLIMELENFIKVYNSRWNVQAFALTDPYYAFMQRVILGHQLLPKLLNLRTKRCKTDEVHSFHLNQYLTSHHRLDRWVPYLTREQALWLYRNIKYIERNAGTKEIFKVLVENILDKRYIPLVEYSIRQLQHFNAQGYPEINARRKQITRASPSVTEDFVSIDAFYQKEAEVTYGSPLYLESHKDKISHLLQTSASSVIQTKDLESSMIDLSSSLPDSLEEVLLRQLVSMSHDGLYNVIVNFQDSKTSVEYALNTWDAITYMVYLQHKSLNIPITKVPCAYNVKYRMHPRPHVNELLKFIEPNMNWLKPVAQDLVSSQPVITECYSVSNFYDMSYQIYQECQKHWKLLAEVHDVYTRGVLEQMILKLFAFQNRDFSRAESAEEWRMRLNLPVYDYSYEEAQTLIKEIFTKATGFVVDDTKQLRSIQKALIELFTTLSSYSIQVIRDINDSEVIQAGGNALRVGNVTEYLLNEAYVKLGIHALSSTTHVKDHIGESCNIKNEVGSVREKQYDYVTLYDYTDLELSVSNEEINTTSIKAVDFDVTQEITDPVTGEMVRTPVKELDQWLSQDALKNLIDSELYA